MPAQDTSGIKDKIIFILKTRGPSLPVHIAKETGLSMLFASAFLSELLSEKKIKISNMKVGNSPVYFLSGQESMLENFSQYLKSKEKDAFILLKEKKFLDDNKQDPAIKIALRAIKDFAIPLRRNERIFWRYFTIPEDEFQISEKKKEEMKEEQTVILKQQEKPLNIFDKQKETKKPTIQKIRKKITQKPNEKFFNKIKGFLLKNQLEILDIIGFSKTDIILKIKENQEERLLIAYNKKRINGADIIKAYKKASEANLEYIILSLGEPLKKISTLISALKNLKKIGNINDESLST